jgi:acyl-CoA reductase-like NAD-dependent aldehyde dehydrogenase
MLHESVDKIVSSAAKSFLGETHGLLLGGESKAAKDGAALETFDPALGSKLATVAHAGAGDVDDAVRIANAALSGPWARIAPAERAKLLLRLADLIEANSDFIAEVESLDSGKPRAHIAFVDIPLSTAALRYYAGWCTKLTGETLPVSAPDMHVYTRREPIGVVAAIVPWNFPLCQACFKVAPALAAGCTVILKPAEQTPLSALILGKLALEAGLPEGVLTVLTGLGATTGQALVDHPGVAKIAFTGSEEVGKIIAARAARTLKHVSLELGGKNPHIIFADADLDAAAATAAMAIFFYTGQVCSAGSRLMIEAAVYDRVVEKILEEAGKLRLGHGLLADTTMGPLISEEQLKRVSKFVEQSREQGVAVATGGKRAVGDLASGAFYEPTVLLNVADTHTVAREEIFGPVLAVQKFETLDELIPRANDVSYGLAAGIWTKNVARAHAAAAAIQAGTVWINTYNQFDAVAPWGGFKQSGYGRDNGAEGLEKYLQTKTVWVNYAGA